jgi:hypothetical protein
VVVSPLSPPAISGRLQWGRRCGQPWRHALWFRPALHPHPRRKAAAGPHWVHEIKHDGYRLQVRRDGDWVRLFTRRGYDWSKRYPAIARTAAALHCTSFTLDGEAVVCGPDGVAIFDALHRRGTVSEAMVRIFGTCRWAEYSAALGAALHRFVLAQQRALEYSKEGRKLVSRAKKAKPINHEQIERLASEAALKEMDYSVESAEDAHSAAFLAAQRRIERIEIRDFKSIEALSIKFPIPQSEDQAWLMLLGENATGKSSILQAVALTLMGQAHANSLGLDAESFLRHNAKHPEGSVEIHLTNLNNTVQMKFGKHIVGFQITPTEPKVLLLGYCATRLLPRPGLGESDQNKAPLHWRRMVRTWGAHIIGDEFPC